MVIAKGDAATGADKKPDNNGDEDRVPTYEEATGQVGASSAAAAAAARPGHDTHFANEQGRSSPAPPLVGPAAVPFPSLGTTQDGYGESPYQSDGTLRIVIARPGDLISYQAQQPRGYVLPGPGVAANGQPLRRGPPAGRRFLVAYLWAIVLYMLFSVALSSLIEYIDPNFDPRRPHPPNNGEGPPGWHHHHGQGRDTSSASGSLHLFDGNNTTVHSFSLTWQPINLFWFL